MIFSKQSSVIQAVILAFVTILNGVAEAQVKEEENTGQRCFMIMAHFGPSIPQGDLALDYKTYGELGACLLYKSKTNWLAGMEYAYLFGNGVKNDPIPNLRTPDGQVIGINGSYASFKVFQRGFLFPVLKFGKVVPLIENPKRNKLGGLSLMAGGGWLQHKTYIQDLSKTVPQFSAEYRDGYDRLTSGIGLGGWIGYLYLPEHGSLNFQVEAGYFQAFTHARRYDFTTQTQPSKTRHDGLLQLRFRISFTIRSRPEETYYYY